MHGSGVAIAWLSQEGRVDLQLQGPMLKTLAAHTLPPGVSTLDRQHQDITYLSWAQLITISHRSHRDRVCGCTKKSRDVCCHATARPPLHAFRTLSFSHLHTHTLSGHPSRRFSSHSTLVPLDPGVNWNATGQQRPPQGKRHGRKQGNTPAASSPF